MQRNKFKSIHETWGASESTSAGKTEALESSPKRYVMATNILPGSKTSHAHGMLPSHGLIHRGDPGYLHRIPQSVIKSYSLDWERTVYLTTSTSQGSAELLCTRIKGANREVSEGKADLWSRSVFPYKGRQGAANRQDSWGFFRDAQGFGRLDVGSRAGFISKASTTMDLGISISLFSV